MLSKSHKILANAALVFAAWLVAGVVSWVVLKYANPAGELTGEELNALSANLRTLGGTVAQIAASMAGFILASLALLLSLSERELIKRMSVSGHLHVLLLRMKLSILLCLVLTVGGVTYIVIPELGTQHLYVAAAALVPVALSVLDVLWKLVMVFFFLSPLPKGAPQATRTLYEDNSNG